MFVLFSNRRGEERRGEERRGEKRGEKRREERRGEDCRAEQSRAEKHKKTVNTAFGHYLQSILYYHRPAALREKLQLLY